MRIADHLASLSPRMQRVLALLVVPAALLSIWAGMIWPIWHTYRAQAHWRATAAHTLARQRGLAEIEEVVRAQLDALPRLNSLQKLYGANADGTVVIALQSDVSRALTAAHARPQSFAPIEVKQMGPLRKVGLRVAVAMTIDQLREFLHRAAELAHFVRIEKLFVTAPPIQTPQENPILNVTLDIAGFAINDKALETAMLAQGRSH